MAVSFTDTIRTLQRSGLHRDSLLIAFGILVFIGWGVWFFLADVGLLAHSAQARLERIRASFPVEAPVAGRVQEVLFSLGQQVQPGDLLLTLDCSEEQFEHQAKLAHIAALEAELQSLSLTVQAKKTAQKKARRAARASVNEMAARFQEAKSNAALAEEERVRNEALEAQKLLPKADARRAVLESRQKRLAAAAAKQSLRKVRLQHQEEEASQNAHLSELLQQAARLEGEIATETVARQQLEYELERCQIKAPGAGILAEVAPLQVGEMVSAGDPLATVVSEGALQVVAEFQPALALGRVHEGQTGRMRLDGFPWAQFGVLEVVVAKVAGELRDDHIRVELALKTDLNPAIPLQHGLPGRVEIEVERLTVARLVLRTAGSWLSDDASRLEASPGAVSEGAP